MLKISRLHLQTSTSRELVPKYQDIHAMYQDLVFEIPNSIMQAFKYRDLLAEDQDIISRLQFPESKCSSTKTKLQYLETCFSLRMPRMNKYRDMQYRYWDLKYWDLY
ncbi:Uncharacterized protein TCM_024144 [Theobroma cacao]|uniref:Uncharacterized protein n=1 Tax=Theobroma cacao TaxID=3641 RepID=A0A061EUV7_THECC|nr:Uncharacterized protein TCM_024144 [Theobroma cacao]